MCCLNALLDRVYIAPDRFVQGVVDGANEASRCAGRFIVNLAKMMRVPDDCDTVLRFVQEGFSLAELSFNTEQVARPIVTALGSMRSTINAWRIVKSIQYVSSGALYRDVVQQRILPLFTHLAFFAARAVSTIHWCVEQKFFSFEKLAETASKIGGKAAVHVVDVIKSTKVLDSLYLLALGGLVAQETNEIQAGNITWSRLFSIASLSMDVLSLFLSCLGMGNAKVFTSLGVAAAGFGLASFFATPGNSCI